MSTHVDHPLFILPICQPGDPACTGDDAQYHALAQRERGGMLAPMTLKPGRGTPERRHFFPGPRSCNIRPNCTLAAPESRVLIFSGLKNHQGGSVNTLIGHSAPIRRCNDRRISPCQASELHSATRMRSAHAHPFHARFFVSALKLAASEDVGVSSLALQGRR